MENTLQENTESIENKVLENPSGDTKVHSGDKGKHFDGPENHSPKNAASKRKVTSKQVVAIIGIVLLVLLYLVTLLVAIFDSSSSGRLFWMCLFSTIAIPLLIWIYTWMYGKLTGRHTITDTDTETSADTQKH